MGQTQNEKVRVVVRREPEAADLPLPHYVTPGAAGMDIYAAISADNPLVLRPGARSLVSTGLRIALPPGYEAQIRPRSGLALWHGIGLVNAPGTIDSDYRGVVQVILINWSDTPFTVKRGDRIAQMVIAPVTRVLLVELAETETLDATERGAEGFGSTGLTSDSLKTRRIETD